MRSIVEEAVPAWFVNANDSEISVLDCTPLCPKIDRQFFPLCCQDSRGVPLDIVWVSFPLLSTADTNRNRGSELNYTH